MHKDALGNEIRVGDELLYFAIPSASVVARTGTVTGFSNRNNVKVRQESGKVISLRRTDHSIVLSNTERRYNEDNPTIAKAWDQYQTLKKLVK